jgi:gamma-glutamylcyclotransferase (GGCT)/AIG2-like uncharacterized protein YtfP/general stress protein 26
MPQLFVYGTLRTPVGGPDGDTKYHHRIADEVGPGQRAELANAELYDFGAYPGIGPGTGTVVGELFDISEEGLAICDVIEGHPSFYTRERATVSVENGGTVEAWVYWAPPTFVDGRTPEPSGDWFTRARTSTITPVVLPDDPALHAVMQRLTDEKFTWLASTRPDGRPHSVPMWHVVHGNRIWFATPSNSVKVDNILGNPSVTITLPDPMDVVIVDAWATRHQEMWSEIAPLFVERYEWDPSAEPDGTQTLIEASPIRIHAWQSETSSQRWTI